MTSHNDTSPLEASPTSRHTLLLAYIVVGLALLVFGSKAVLLLLDGSRTLQTDMSAYYSGSRHLLQHEFIYPTRIDFSHPPLPYIYPPLLAFVFTIFPSYESAWWSWAAFSISCWIAALGTLLYTLRAPLTAQLKSRVWWLVLLAGLINFPPLLVHLTWGQTQLLILLLTTGAWLLLRRAQSSGAGALLGVGIMLKLFPAIFLIPLLAGRHWRLLITSGVVAVGGLLASFAVIGWHQTIFFWTHVMPQINTAFPDDPQTHSITISLGLLLSNNTLAHTLGMMIRILVLLAICGTVLRFQPAPEQALALGITMFLLVTSVIWTHYLVLVYLPWLDALARSSRRQLPLLAIAYVGIALAPLIFYVPDNVVFLVHGLPVIGLLLLLAVQLQQVAQATDLLHRSTTVG